MPLHTCGPKMQSYNTLSRLSKTTPFLPHAVTRHDVSIGCMVSEGAGDIIKFSVMTSTHHLSPDDLRRDIRNFRKVPKSGNGTLCSVDDVPIVPACVSCC